MSAGVVGSIHFQCGSMGCSEIFAVPAKEYLDMRESAVFMSATLDEAYSMATSGSPCCRHCWMNECKRINNYALENRHKSFDGIRASWGRLSADWHEFWLSMVQGTTNQGQTLSDIKDIPFLLDDLATLLLPRFMRCRN